MTTTRRAIGHAIAVTVAISGLLICAPVAGHRSATESLAQPTRYGLFCPSAADDGHVQSDGPDVREHDEGDVRRHTQSARRPGECRAHGRVHAPLLPGTDQTRLHQG